MYTGVHLFVTSYW